VCESDPWPSTPRQPLGRRLPQPLGEGPCERIGAAVTHFVGDALDLPTLRQQPLRDAQAPADQVLDGGFADDLAKVRRKACARLRPAGCN